jgi:outer membrane protein assembly factor BamB
MLLKNLKTSCEQKVVMPWLKPSRQSALFFIMAFLVVALSTALAQETTALHLAWRMPLNSVGDPPIGIPAIADDRLFVVASDIRAYSVSNGRLLWQAPLQSYAPRALVVSSGMVIIPEAMISARDIRTGNKIWEFTPDANASLGRAAADSSAFYCGTSSHHIYALRLSDGQKLWSTDLAPEWEYPAVVRGISIFDETVYAALEQWRNEKGTNSSGWLIALEAKTGKLLWRFKTGDGNQRKGLSSSPLVTSQLVITGDYLSNAVVAVDRKTGQEAWRFQGEPGFVGFPETPVLIGDVIYAASGDTYVYALDLATGRLKWRSKMPGANEAYVICGENILVNHLGLSVLDPQNGHTIQVALHGEDEFPTSGFAVNGKNVFVLGPKAVYAFSCR